MLRHPLGEFEHAWREERRLVLDGDHALERLRRQVLGLGPVLAPERGPVVAQRAIGSFRPDLG